MGSQNHKKSKKAPLSKGQQSHRAAAIPKDKDGLMDALEAAFDADDAEGALELSNELITRFPEDEECLCLHASALSMGGCLDEALEFCGQALEAHPESLDLVQQAAELLIQSSEEDPDALDEAEELLKKACRMGEEKALLAVKAGAVPESDSDLMLLEEQLSDLYLQTVDVETLLGDPERAMEAADKAKALFPEDPDVLTCRGNALFELCRFEEARDELEHALSLSAEGEDDDRSWTIYSLGLVLDHLGQRGKADELIARAHKLSPESCPAQIKISSKDFDLTLEKSLEALPEKVRNYLQNVAILVEELPSLEDLRQETPPLSPNSLGLFRGTPASLQSTADPWSVMPSAIVLYQRNLERFVKSKQELEEEITVTFLHEVGHFLGLDERQVAELGLR